MTGDGQQQLVDHLFNMLQHITTTKNMAMKAYTTI